MLIDLRVPSAPFRGAEESVLATGALLRAISAGRIDPSTTRAAMDWVQYRNNFREPVTLREVVGTAGALRREISVDLRRVDANAFDKQLEAALSPADDALALEPWVSLSHSCIWRLNALYWQELATWEQASGRGYVQALPGGESSGTNRAATRASIEELFHIWGHLQERRSLPDQLTVLEIGVGSGEQAKVFLDEFRALDHQRGAGYYRRLHYLMGDYSPHVLERARSTVAEHRSRISTLVLDAARPSETLRFLESKLFFVYISNVYDNLPSDELAVLDDRFYLVEVRAKIPRGEAAAIGQAIGVGPAEVVELALRLLRLGPQLMVEWRPELFPDATAAARFWQELWSALRLDERYVPLGPLDLYEIADGMHAEVLALLFDGHGDVRFHASNGAIGSLLDTLPLLHPLGALVSHDLFVTDLEQYREGFRGPGKFDGSVVNWVNGPLLKSLAARRGFNVEFASFDHGSRSPIVTATARARE